MGRKRKHVPDELFEPGANGPADMRYGAPTSEMEARIRVLAEREGTVRPVVVTVDRERVERILRRRAAPCVRCGAVHGGTCARRLAA